MISEFVAYESGPFGQQMVWPLNNNEQLVHYQLELLTRCKPAFLLPGCLRYRSGTPQISLDTTGLKPLDLLMTEQDLNAAAGLKILSKLCRYLSEAEDFLLPINQFMLRPSDIYFCGERSDESNFRLAFWPVRQSDSAMSGLDDLLPVWCRAFHIEAGLSDQLVERLKMNGLQGLRDSLARSVSPLSGCPEYDCSDRSQTKKTRTSGGQMNLRKIIAEVHSQARGLLEHGWQLVRPWLMQQTEDDPQAADNRTVLKAANPADFRMALLSEGKPGSPAESEGIRAYILVDEFLVGRDQKCCDLCLADLGIGRQHARIIRRAGSFFISDLGSRNGTRVDDQRLEKFMEKQLPDRCLIQFADHSFYFQVD